MIGLQIKLNKEIAFKNEFDSIITTENYRDSIIKMSNNEPSEILRIINNMENSYPNIVYAKPYKDTVRIFGFGDKGVLAINSIFKNVLLNKGLKIKDETYQVVGIPTINDNFDFLPHNNGRWNTYTTITPINIFNRHNHKVFKSILCRYFENGIFDASKTDKVEAFYKNIQEFATENLRDSIAYMCASILNRNKSEFEFVNSINFEWEDMIIVHRKYHSQEMKMPMIKGRFKCNFVLPKFIGYKIGKGFGELSLKNGN